MIEMKTLWIIGIVLIVISTSFLGIKVTHFNNLISKQQDTLDRYESNREVRFRMNVLEYQHYRIKERIERLTQLYAEVNNLDTKLINAVNHEYKTSRIQSLHHLHIACYGKSPSQEKINQWEKMNIDELIKVEEKMPNQEEVDKFMSVIKSSKKEISRLENKKNKLIIYSVIIQVIGLVLINIAEYYKK